MQPILTFLNALLLSPLIAFAQAKPEVANATKAARRAWESAPAEMKALWLQQREALKHVDLSDDTKRQIVIARARFARAGRISRASDHRDAGGQQDDFLCLEHRPWRTRGADGPKR
jgi:hypothetical protein